MIMITITTTITKLTIIMPTGMIRTLPIITVITIIATTTTRAIISESEDTRIF